MRRAALLLAALALGFAPVPFPNSAKPRSPEDDLKALEGEWRRDSLSIDGRPGGVGTVAVIKDGRMAFGTPGDDWNLTLDTSTTPRRIDSRRVKDDPGIDPFWAVYRLEGDTLYYCDRQGKDVSARPAGFDPAQRNVWLATYRRVKN